MLFICLWIRSDKHVVVSQQLVCLWEWKKPQGQTCWVQFESRDKKKDTKQLNCRFLWELSHCEFVEKTAVLQKWQTHDRTSWQVFVHFETTLVDTGGNGNFNNELSILRIHIGHFSSSWLTSRANVQWHRRKTWAVKVGGKGVLVSDFHAVDCVFTFCYRPAFDVCLFINCSHTFP